VCGNNGEKLVRSIYKEKQKPIHPLLTSGGSSYLYAIKAHHFNSRPVNSSRAQLIYSSPVRAEVFIQALEGRLGR
jgi:hypothetical protein